MKLLKITLVALLALSQTGLSGKSNYGEWADPNVGSMAILLRTQGANIYRPNSMIRIQPATYGTVNFDTYLSDNLYGISFNYRFVTNGLKPAVGIFATTGKPEPTRRHISSFVDRQTETLYPWFHKVNFQNYDIDAMWTTTERNALFRFIFPKDSKTNNVIFVSQNGGRMEVDNSGAVTIVKGSEPFSDANQYFYAVFDRKMETARGMDIKAGKMSQDNVIKGGDIAMCLTSANPGAVVVKVGLSLIDIDQARTNLEKESLNKSFEQVAKESEKAWDNLFDKIKVEGGTLREKKIFYSAMYRCHERMADMSEYGRYYSGFDGRVHTDRRPFYNDDAIWDNYRTSHPLQTILNPKMEGEELQSIVMMYENFGWILNFPSVAIPEYKDNVDLSKYGLFYEPMIGNHWAVTTAEALAKGITNFDIEKMYEGLKKNALEGTNIPRRGGKAQEIDRFYSEHGFFPGLAVGEPEPYPYINEREKRQSVSVTLENSYDDWCMAQIAKYLGKMDDYELFMKRSNFYLNLWDPKIKYFAPKNANGEWIRPFDPEKLDGIDCRIWFAEVSGINYRYSVQHDVRKLIELIGGNEKFIDELDTHFTTPPKMGKKNMYSQMADGTGLHGQISMGNEPAMHIPFMYAYAGAPWKTQHRVRQCCEVWYNDRPLGYSGDEDGGGLSSWYVFASMGIYPYNPADGMYVICSPVFTRVSITQPNGKVFTIKAPNASRRNKYIQSAKLNGKPYNSTFLSHRDIVAGSTLELVLGEKPNTKWGVTE